MLCIIIQRPNALIRLWLERREDVRFQDLFRRGGLDMAVAITRDDLSASDLSCGVALR